MSDAPPANKLWYGDCLTIMQDHMRGSSVDLIYLDPPFNSNQEYNAIYKDETGRPLPDQIEAFCDLWELDEERERALRTMPVLMRESGIDDDVVEFWRLWMNALRNTQPRLLAYLSYMVERLIIMKGLLRPTGGIYLHCDPTASHYIKIMMDAIFGYRNFRNEIKWRRSNPKSHGGSNFPNRFDTILRYSKSATCTFNKLYEPHNPDYVASAYVHIDERGRYRLLPLLNPNRNRPNLDYELLGVRRVWRWSKERMAKAVEDGIVVQTKPGAVPQYKKYLADSKGRLITNDWDDILPASGNEHMGYDTQKPVALLERIISASTNKGDVVLDPFCGCATTVEAAHNLGRRWIGIDIAIHAIKRVAKVRLSDRLKLAEGVDFKIDGVPRTVEGARDLWERDKYHFQKWAVEQIDGFVTTKRTADGGIDGRLYFDMPGKEDLQSMAIEVKGGKNVNIRDVRALFGVLKSDEAHMAGLIIMEPLGSRKEQNFRKLMAEAGDFTIETHLNPYPRMQMLTVQDILDGKRFHTPGAVGRGDRQRDLYT